MGGKLGIGFLLALVLLAAEFGGPLSRAQAASSDAVSSAGPVTGVIILLSPALAAGPVVVPSPAILTPRRGLITPTLPAIPSGPALPSILVLAPMPATGSLVVPLRVPLVGSGPSLVQLQLVIPGPNPYQNTTIGLSQLLNTVLASMQQTRQQETPSGTPAPPLVNVF